MKKILQLIASVCLVGALAGCEWTATSSEDSYSNNAEYSWVNFSGTYRGNNGYLVSKYSTSSGSGGSSGNQQSVKVPNENQGIAPKGPQTLISGRLLNTPIVPGSVTINFYSSNSVTVGTFRDDGANKLAGNYVIGSGAVPIAGAGSIDYNTGTWTINLTLPGLEAEADIVASYAYYASSSSSSSSGPESGASGGPIYAFTVQHNGSSVVITDNNGATYSGTMSPPVFTSDNSPSQTGDTGSTSSSGNGEVVAQFSAAGESAARYHVTIIGTFQGYYTADQRVTDRTMTGTWKEEGGMVGDINGVADSTVPSTTN